MTQTQPGAATQQPTEPNPPRNDVDGLIKSIHLNEANLQSIIQHRRISGTLYTELKRILAEHTAALLEELERKEAALQRRKEASEVITNLHDTIQQLRAENAELKIRIEELLILCGTENQLRAENDRLREGVSAFVDWIHDNNWKRTPFGWCQSGKEDGWHCKTMDLLAAFRQGRVGK